jgi:branched-chain amino acid transport system substrate-binding protein
MATIRLGALAALILCAAAPARAETVKIGLMLPYSGPFGSLVKPMEDAINLYMKQHAADLGPHQIELIKRDTTGPAPDVAKRLAQDLIARDKVQLITGLVFTPNALAIAPLATEAKVPLVIMNAATAVITTTSPYIVRVSLTLPQVAEPEGIWAATKGGFKSVFTAVSDYGPGIDAEQAFTQGFTEHGGTIAGSVRLPLQNPDFAPFLQRIRDAKPQAVYVFLPAGKQTTAFMKEFQELGLRAAGVTLLASGDIVAETELPNIGDVALGVVSSMHYSAQHKSPANEAFIKAWHEAYGKESDPDFFSVGAYDGMHLIYDIIKKLDGKIDGDKAMEIAKGWAVESPRGPIAIDPATRDIVQNVYLRRVEKVEGRLANVEIETFPNQKDPWKERQGKK